MPRDAFEHIIGEMKRFNANGFIVIGGGSPIGLAKAAAGDHRAALHRDRHHLFRLGNGGALVYRRCR